jgi:hypothetical protein
MIVAAIAILVGVFVAASGRGGELAYEPADHAPLDLGPVSATDVAMLRPPTAMWGYNMQVTDEALERIARSIRERDVTIAYLQSKLANLSPGTTAPRPAAETSALGSAAETSPLGSAAETSPLGSAAETSPLGSAAETSPLGSAAETSPLGRAAETSPPPPSAEPPTLEDPPAPTGGDGALAPEEQPR